MRLQHLLIISLLAFAVDLPAQADAWQANLKDGGTVRVDPQTRKPTLYYGGGSTQLWDGVHEMEDGSVITVRDGVVVPDESMLHTWAHPTPTEPADQVTPCEKLARKACGLQGQCASTHACGLARQLQRLEKQGLAKGGPKESHASVQDCREGLLDLGLFPTCDKDTGVAEESACRRLVTQACGSKEQCRAAPGCNLARQLLGLERDERLSSKDPLAETDTGRQCREAQGNPAFPPCR
jgi:hypothetical protein